MQKRNLISSFDRLLVDSFEEFGCQQYRVEIEDVPLVLTFLRRHDQLIMWFDAAIIPTTTRLRFSFEARLFSCSSMTLIFLAFLFAVGL